MQTPAWIKRFWADFLHKEFMPIKILFFLMYGASMAMFPFLTIQARSLGITEKELGIVYAFTPAITIIGPPLTGMIADKIGNFKVFLSLTLAASGGAAIVFSAVPVARRYHTLPESLPLTLSLVGDGPASLSVPPPLQCDYLPLLDNLTITIANCSLCDPSSLLQGGCVPQGPSVCVGQQLEAPGEAEVQVLPVTPHANASNVTYLEVIHWSDAAFPTQTGGEVEECAIACSAAGARVDLCSNTVSVEVIDPMLTFWCYLLVRVLNGFTLAASFTLFDGAAMAILKEHSGDYGLQRLYGNLGAIFLTPISGLLIDRSSEENGDQDYRPAFYLYCALKVVGAVVILFLDLDFRKPSNKVLKDFRGLLKKPEILAFLVVMLISGICFGVLDTFLFWLLQDLGAKKYLMGITVTVGSLAGIPILVASGSIFKKLGLANTIILGFAFYVFRMLGYSFITNPWWCMPFEALECFTVSLMSAAAVSYAADLATPATLATLQGVYGGLYYGVGRGLGSLVGGFLIGPLGVRNTFRIMALVCAVTCIVYFILNRLFFVKAQEERKLKAEKEKKDEKEAVTEERSTDKELGNVVENSTKKDTKDSVNVISEEKANKADDSAGQGQLNNAFDKNE
ncbi:major facilitator superfamily domain-containing protein 6-like isoform X2 [Portunus trituberculatus]|nr:major facilitator superfamily domain-containing protein 6-like isoform X2 [Portunus trituberculatus]XP_045110372.1 major facilitator superfamily domain-containing protein 6-like isoform X2 [Portunus trituberculatus]